MITLKRFDALLCRRQGALTLLMTRGVLILTVHIDYDAGCTHIDGTH
jgi:hypothetical protein